MNAHPPGRGVLTPQEVSILLKEELSLELGLATAGYFDPDRDDAGLARSHRIFGEAYRIAAANGGEGTMTDNDRSRLKRDGWSIRDLRSVTLSLKCYCSNEEADIGRRLTDMGLSSTQPLIRQARIQLLRARAEAQDRAAMFAAAEANAPFDPVSALLTMPRMQNSVTEPLALPAYPVWPSQ